MYYAANPLKVLLGLLIGLLLYIIVPLIIQFAFSHARCDLIEKGVIGDSSQEVPTVIDCKHDSFLGVFPKTKETVEIQSIDVENKRISLIDFDRFVTLIVLAFWVGSTGSIVSILFRLKQYTDFEFSNKSLPLLVALFKPIIGGTFGVVITSILLSGLSPITINNISFDGDSANSKGYEAYVLVIWLSFVSGFSERFASDMISHRSQSPGSSKDSST